MSSLLCLWSNLYELPLMIKTLAIETSCDDTSLGIVTYDQGSFANPLLKTYSQIADHQLFGGVVPEVAYRLHEEKILDIIKEIWYKQIEDCDCISVTKEPWLPGSLVVGNTVASMLACFFDKPLYRVNHIQWHVLSLLLDRNESEITFPLMVLTASGGHNELYVVRSLGHDVTKSNIVTSALINLETLKIGYSLDDAAGESFDKVARMLWGSYPGWPWIDKQALVFSNTREANHKQWERRPFKRILLDGKWTNMSQERIDQNIYNFSFSWMKSQVYQFLQKFPIESLSESEVQELCREFQECVTDILVNKVLKAAKDCGAKTIGIVWGVSANDRLYEKACSELSSDMALWNATVQCLRPVKKVYSMDNAAMIGVVGILKHLDYTR